GMTLMGVKDRDFGQAAASDLLLNRPRLLGSRDEAGVAVADEVLAVRLEPRSPALVVADVLVEDDEVDRLEATFVREEIAEGLGREPSQRHAEQAVVKVAAEHD